jgi:hypothetical protein
MGDPNPLAGIDHLDREWLKDTARLAAYEAWTERENESWIVSKDTRQTRHEAFWEAWKATHQAQPAKTNIAKFQKKAV